MTQTIILNSQHKRRSACNLIQAAPEGYVVEISAPKRSTEQNSRMWAMLSDISRARVGGQGYPPEYQKSLAMDMAGHKPIWLPAWSGDGLVCVGYKSSRLTVAEMSDLQTVIEAYAAEHNIELRS